MAGSLCYLMYSESEIRVLFGFLAFWPSHGRINVLFDVFGVGDTRVVGFLAFWLSRDMIAMLFDVFGSEIRVLLGFLAFWLSHGRITVLFDVFGVGDTRVVWFPSFMA